MKITVVFMVLAIMVCAMVQESQEQVIKSEVLMEECMKRLEHIVYILEHIKASNKLPISENQGDSSKTVNPNIAVSSSFLEKECNKSVMNYVNQILEKSSKLGEKFTTPSDMVQSITKQPGTTVTPALKKPKETPTKQPSTKATPALKKFTTPSDMVQSSTQQPGTKVTPALKKSPTKQPSIKQPRTNATLALKQSPTKQPSTKATPAPKKPHTKQPSTKQPLTEATLH